MFGWVELTATEMNVLPVLIVTEEFITVRGLDIMTIRTNTRIYTSVFIST